LLIIKVLENQPASHALAPGGQFAIATIFDYSLANLKTFFREAVRKCLLEATPQRKQANLGKFIDDRFAYAN